MIRVVLVVIFAALVSTTPAQSETRSVLNVLEVVCQYGDNRDLDRDFTDGDGEVFELTRGLRIRGIEIEGSGRREFGHDANFIEYEIESRDVDGTFHVMFGAATRWQRHGYYSHKEPVEPSSTLRRLRNIHWHRTNPGGGTYRDVFFMIDVIGDDRNSWPRPLGRNTPERFLAEAIRRFHLHPSTDSAAFVISLMRYVPLADLPGEVHAESLLEELEEYAARRVAVVVHRGRRMATGGANVLEQARLVNTPQDFVTRKEDVIELLSLNQSWGDDPSEYAVYQFILENDRHAPNARLVALGRTISRHRTVRYHDDYIARLKSGELPADEPVKNAIIAHLESEVNGRRLSSLLGLVGGGMASLVLLLVVLRFLARRTMFA